MTSVLFSKSGKRGCSCEPVRMEYPDHSADRTTFPKLVLANTIHGRSYQSISKCILRCPPSELNQYQNFFCRYNNDSLVVIGSLKLSKCHVC